MAASGIPRSVSQITSDFLDDPVDDPPVAKPEVELRDRESRTRSGCAQDAPSIQSGVHAMRPPRATPAGALMKLAGGSPREPRTPASRRRGFLER
jgi:hypothetical protein